MKSYEKSYDYSILGRVLIIRLDSKCFSKFTQDTEFLYNILAVKDK